jgi:hypothetical protein
MRGSGDPKKEGPRGNAPDCLRHHIPLRSRAPLPDREANEEASAHLVDDPDDPRHQSVLSWWERSTARALADLLRLDHRRLQGTNITSQTASVLRLRPTRLQPINTISPDGISFPSTPPAFLAEVQQQARELYGGRHSVRMDTRRLLAGSSLSTSLPADTPDYITLMSTALRSPARQIDAPISHQELRQLLRSGSDASALDELPRGLLQLLDSHGLAALIYLIGANPPAGTSDLLHSVLHLPLRKKEPVWLLRNSRPVLLEPYLRLGFHGQPPPGHPPPPATVSRETIKL